MGKKLALGGMVAATVLAVAACSGGSGATSGDQSSAKGGDLVIARNGEGVTMNSTSAQFENYSIYVFQQMGESLFTVTDDGKTLKPWLAKGYKQSADELTYTIELRDDVKFHDGKPMTAKDVKFSIDANTKTGATGWGFVNSAIKKVEAVDDHTVKLNLKYPWAPIIADLSMFSNAIVPENYGGKTAEQFYTAPVLTGPFKWGEWQKGQFIKVVKNDNYWQPDKPSLDSVTWKVVPDANTRKLQLQGGQIDINTTPDWSSFASLKATPGIVAKAFPSTQIDYVAMNTKRKPFNDKNVRRAIAYAIDRQALVKAVLFGNGEAANSMLSPGTPFYNKANEGPTFDIAKAKQELAKSSQPNGFTTTLLIRSGEANHSAVAQILQDSLKKIGITIKIKQLDATANKQARVRSDFDLALSAWTMDIPDPDQWTSFALDPKGGANSAYTFYDNPAVMTLNREAQREGDKQKRTDLYNKIQYTAAQDAALAYLYYSPYAYAYTDKVKNFHVTPMGNYHLEDVQKSS